METFPKFTNQEIPSDGNPGPFPAFGNVGAPYMAMLSLHGLTVGLPVCLFSTSLVSSVPATVPSTPPPEECHVDLKLDISPSSPVPSSSSSASLGESLDSSTQVIKRKKKKTKKKKSDKGEANSIVFASKTPALDEPSNPPWKFKFPKMLCKGDHLL